MSTVSNLVLPNALNYCFWNIRGYKSTIIGNKLIHKDFLENVENCDIVGLAETHIHDDVLSKLSIPGYTRINYIIRTANSKGKGSGGVAIFCKLHLTKYVTPVSKGNDNVAWVKIDKSLCGKDIFLGTVYFSPSGTKEHISKQYRELSEEIAKFQHKGEVIIQGDFNARTGREKDFVNPHIIDENYTHREVENMGVLQRNSEDTTINKRGEELLELCKSLDMVILNGRKAGDPWGNMTSHQHNGSSVVDYVIVSVNLLREVRNFSVGEFSAWVSDHCHLLFEIKSVLNIPKEQEKLAGLPGSFRFKEGDLEKYITCLKLEENLEMLEELTDSQTEAESLVTKTTEILLNTCKNAGIKPKKQLSNKVSDPWFDDECEKLKKSIKKKCRLLKINPKNDAIRKEILCENKSLKKMIKRKKQEYKEKIVQEMSLSKGDHKTFWKLLEKIQKENKNASKDHIPPKRWNEHFTKILRDKNGNPTLPPDSDKAGSLDYDINLEELKKAAYILRLNKASGFDSLSNEMIIALMEVKPELIVVMFNQIFQGQTKVENWSIAMISPIFKSGIEMDPGNYRGISVLSCLGKLFSSVLNQRLLKYVLDNNILNKAQLGFVSGNRTSDAHIILYNLLQLQCHSRGRNVYSCFIDFRKAFDSIPRDKLFEKLLRIGVDGKFFNNIKILYQNDICQVKMSNGLTESFLANQGVKQGCILSPLLFNIFLADFSDYVSKPECHPVKVLQEEMSCIMWADDIILFSQSEEGLQSMLDNLYDYTVDNGMQINADKTKVMIFNKTGRFFRRTFRVGNEQIFSTHEYKYLGFLITPSGSITAGLKNLKDRALKAYYKLKSGLGYYFYSYPGITCYLFDTMIKPILLYASDFWGCLKLDDNNPIDNAHMRFCKDLLGVQKQTPNTGVLLELGRLPLTQFAKKNCIKNWRRIHIQKKANPLLLASHRESLLNKLIWTDSVYTCLNRIGIQVPQRGKQLLENVSWKRLTDIFYQKSFSEVNSGGKLRTYAILKTEIGRVGYLDKIGNYNKRRILTKIRLSNHTLMIEKGRHKGLDKEERICPFCGGDNVEDEYHFIFECPTFIIPRRELFDKICLSFPNFHNLPPTEKLKIALDQEETAEDCCTFLEKAFFVREFLINKPKNNM